MKQISLMAALLLFCACAAAVMLILAVTFGAVLSLCDIIKGELMLHDQSLYIVPLFSGGLSAVVLLRSFAY